jgi:hypothetical protein
MFTPTETPTETPTVRIEGEEDCRYQTGTECCSYLPIFPDNDVSISMFWFRCVRESVRESHRHLEVVIYLCSIHNCSNLGL